MKLGYFIPKIESFVPIVSGRNMAQAMIQNPTQRDLEAYGKDLGAVSRNVCQIQEAKRVALSGFCALAINPLIGAGVWAAYSYGMDLITKYIEKDRT